MSNKNKSWFYYTIATFLSLMVLFGCKSVGHLFKGKKVMVMPSMQLSVVAASPCRASVKRYIDTVGQCTAYENVALVPQVEGEVVNILRKNGGKVEKGELLFEIKSDSFRAYLKQAEAQLAIDRARLNLNKTQLERSKALRTGDFVSQQEYDGYQANVEEYEARIMLDEASCALKHIDVDHCVITAPLRGELSKSSVDNHVFVNKGTVLAVLNQVQPIYADFFLSEKHLIPILKARNSSYEIIVEARLLDDNDVVQYGRLVFVDNEVDKSTGSFGLRAEFKNEDCNFWAGRAVDIKIYYEVLENILLIPEGAIHIGQKGSFVYVINGENTAEMRTVDVGQSYEGWVVIHVGLEGTEKVIAEGHALLAPGSKVMEVSTVPAPQLHLL